MSDVIERPQAVKRWVIETGTVIVGGTPQAGNRRRRLSFLLEEAGGRGGMSKAERLGMADGSMTMTQSTKQSAGVWLDHEQAILITHDAESGDFAIGERLKSGNSHSRGGGSEHAINHAQRTEDQKFFKSLATHLQPFDEILLFGPGKIQEQFHNHLSEDAQFKNKQITLESAEHMTDPQLVAQVRNFFNKS